MINDGDAIDGQSINDVYRQIDNIKDKLVKLLWRNATGNNDKTIKSLDGNRLQVLAGVVPVNDRTSKSDESSIDVKFYNAFGGNKAPTVVAMPQSPSPYGVSVKKVNKEGFTLVIHQFPDNAKDDRLNINAIHYIAVGMP